MLERIVSKLLMRYLRDYIEKIDSSQMEIAALRGYVKLQNLSLKEEALIQHMVPLRIIKGTIGLIEIKFPWQHLETELCRITINDIFIVLKLEKEVLIKRDLQPKQSAIKQKAKNQELSSEDEANTWQSIINSIFDNAIADIQNIHIRLEIPTEFNTIAIGLILPSITLRTVDQDKNIIKPTHGELITRKRLLTQQISLYLDALSDPIDIDDFSKVMIAEMKKNHQFILEPFIIDIVMVHSREKDNPVKNQIDILIDKLSTNLDYLQSRAIMEIAKDLAMFQKQRSFIHCMRPAVFENTAQLWGYTFRCAVSIMRPYEFKPGLALVILKNRKVFLKRMRESMKGFSMFKSYKNRKLKQTENSIGQQATLFLTSYCDAVLAKEMKINSSENDLTPLEISDIQQINKKGEHFFTKDTFSLSFGMKLMEISLNYSKGTPLAIVSIRNTSASYSSLGDEVAIYVKVNSLEMISYVDDKPKPIFTVQKTLPNFFSFESQAVGKRTVSTDLCNIDSFVFRPDYKSISTAFDFFFKDRTKSADQLSSQNKETTNIRIFRIDAFDNFKLFLKFCNRKLSFKMRPFSLIYPFNHGGKTDELKFTISDIDFSKYGDIFYPSYAPVIKVAMDINLTVDDLTFSNNTIISSFKTTTKFIMAFTKTNMELDFNTSVTPIIVSIDHFPADNFKSFISSFELFSIFKTADFYKIQKIVSFHKVKMDYSFVVQSVTVYLKEMEIDTAIKFSTIELQMNYYKGISTMQIFISPFSIVDNEIKLMEMTEDLKIMLTKESETQPFTLSMNVIHPYIKGDMNWVLLLFDIIKMYLKVLNVPLTNNDDDQLHPPFHLNILITSPHIDISRTKNTPFVSFQTMHVHDDENFTIYVDLNGFQILRKIRKNHMIIQEGSSDSELLFSFDKKDIKSKYIQAFKPLNFSIIVETKEKIKVKMNLPKVEMTASQIEYSYILPFISHILEVIPVETQPKNEVTVDMFIEEVNLLACDNDVPFINVNVKNIKIDVLTSLTNISVKFSTKRIYICQLYGDLYPNQNIENKSMLDVPGFNLKFDSGISDIQSDIDTDSIYLEIPSGVFGLSDRFLKLVPFFANFDYPPYPLPRKESHIQVIISIQPVTVTFFDAFNSFLIINLGASKFCILTESSHSEMTELDIIIDSLLCKSTLYDEKVIEINKKIQFLIKEQVLIGHFHNLFLTISLPLIIDIAKFFSPLKDCNPPDDETEGIPFDFEVSFEEIGIKALTAMKRGPHCLGSIVNPKFVMNSSEKIAAFSVDSIILSSGYLDDFQKKFIEVSNIFGYFRFNLKKSEENEVQSNEQQITYDYVFALKHHKFVPALFENLLIDIHVHGIDLTYTHQMALAVIGCFIPHPDKSSEKEEEENDNINTKSDSILMLKHDENQNEKEIPNKRMLPLSKGTTDDYEEDEEDEEEEIDLDRSDIISSSNNNSPKAPKNTQKTKMKIVIKTDSFSLTLSIIQPIAFFKVSELSVLFDDDKWDAIIKTALIKPSEEHSQELKIPLFQCPPDKNLIQFQMKGDDMLITFQQANLFFDYNFWIPMISFITQSPFLHIQSIFEGKENAVKESVSIPFKVSLIADKFCVTLPVSLSYDTCQMLLLEMGYTASFADNVLDASINDLRVHVYDQIKKINFSPIIENMSLIITDSRFDENKIRLHAFISPLKIVLSAFDFILIGLISRSFDESISKLVVSADNSAIIKPDSETQVQHQQITADIQLEIGKMKILIVKDNRSSSRFTPIFKIKNTPINLVMNSSENISISLGVSPYISYFNESSGQWDLIIEPLAMNVLLDLSQSSFGIKGKTVQPVNINLPTSAISQFITLWNEIKNNISQKDIVFENIPMGWFQNNLGSDILVKYTDNEEKQREASVKSLETVEIEDIEQNTNIIVKINGKETTILTRYLIYPTIFSKQFSVRRKPYKGGILIQFNPPIQLVNKLGIDFTLYEKNGEEYKEIQVLKSGARCPLAFNDGGKHKEFTFTDPKYKNNSNHLIAKISPFDTNTFNITIILPGLKIRCVVFIESDSVSKIFKVLPFVVGLNLLPFPLYIKISKKQTVFPTQSKLESSSGSGFGHFDESSEPGAILNTNDMSPNDKYDIITIGANESVPLLFIDSSTNQFIGSLSMKEGAFSSKASVYRIKKTISAIPVYPDLTIAYKSEMVDDQLKITFFVPCVFYNLCADKEIIIKEVAGKQQIEKKIEKDGSHLLWCPQSYIANNDQLSVYVSLKDTQKIQVNCREFQKGTLFLKSNTETDLYNSLRYHIVTRQGISVVTFSTLLIIRNELPFNITLHPLESTPKNFENDINPIGIPNKIKANSDSSMDLMSRAGSFIIFVEGFWNSPAISLLEQRKIVFKMHRNVPEEIINNIDSEEYMSSLSKFYEVLEVEIFDDATSFIAIFRKSSFPTPIVIANMLSHTKIQVYQKIDKSPFIVEPESTSIFAFDEPLGYPNANLIIKGVHFNISLIEDTEQILLKENLKRERNKKLSLSLEFSDISESSNSSQITLGQNSSSIIDALNSCDSSDNIHMKSLSNFPIYVKIKQNISGIKTVFISSKKEIPPSGLNLELSLEIPSIFISIIDLKMREFCLLTLSEMKGRLNIRPSGTAFQFELGEFQIDDQNPLAPNPVILHGRRGRTKKSITTNGTDEEEISSFLKFDGLLTNDTKPFTSSKYISMLMQRIDIQIDSSFLSDAINMSMKLAKPIKIPIHPVKAKKLLKNSSNDSIVTYNWLEVSPIYMLFIYKNLTGRPTSISPMFYPMRFIPSIATTKIMFPGIIVAHITDRLNFIIEKVSNDYKTAALEQVLESLGTSGKILTTFGITATIAEKLDIPMKSELTDISTSLQNFQSVKSEEYDNRKEINGYFSQETLSALQTSIKEFNLRSSSTIENVLTLNESSESSNSDSDNKISSTPAVQTQENNGRLMIRDFPGSGFGHGIVGVLKKATIDIMTDVKVMSGIERKRVPRAFPNNRIEKFDEEICTVQTTIQMYGKTFEKILMKTKNKVKGDYVCITERAIYFIPQPLDKVRVKIKIKEIKAIRIDGNSITIEYGILKKPEVIACDDKNEVECFKRYLDSQKIYSDLFIKSIV